ncbi:hypothetical protein [Roseivirga thermotolerans]|uniref:hypothetical protein n=1 Tax=Roseivirga thermotolerans TaxID=1758176 RepID=UPI001678C25B|nr:hypothetical protein [Roseivirga thermotolerans]
MTKTPVICLMVLCLLSSCGIQMICPAYHSSFVLDEDHQRDLYSLFTVVDGDTVPKRPYGFKYKAEGDSMMEKFIKGTEGKGFRVQTGRVHSLEKAGFTYENRVKEKLWVKIFSGREKPVLENPYLFDRITKKRPFYKLDQLETELVHFNSAAYDSLVRATINRGDTAAYDRLMQEYNALPPAIQAQHAPLLRGGFNVEQDEYDKRYKDYFLELPEPPAPIDSSLLKAQQPDTLATDTTSKKGILGLFKKKGNKSEEKPPKKERKRDRKNNDEGILNEDDDN